MNRNKGFTLIELLVVVAIIGILATVVLSNLNSANEKGANASIKMNGNTIRSEAQIYFTMHNNGYYVDSANNVCTAVGSPVINNAIREAYSQAKQGGGIILNDTAQTAATTVPLGTATAVCHVSTTGRAYAVSLPLRGQEGTGATIKSFYCVDSTGFAGVRVNPLPAGPAVAGYVCPAT